MSFQRFIPVILCVAMTLSLTSCDILMGRKIDVVNPTVEEMDQLDTQWGLTTRKSRGGPRRNFQYVEPTKTSGARMSQEGAAPEIPARETVNGAPQVSLDPEAPATSAPPVVVPSKLR